MKKAFSLLAVLAVTVFMASSVWAAITNYATKAARVTFTAADLSFDVSLYRWGGSGSYETEQTTASQINFEPGDVTIGSTSEFPSTSKDFALITSNLNQQPANTHVYVYTDNKNNTTDFVAVSSGTDGFNGLVRKGQGATWKAGDYAKVITKCVAVSSANANYNTTNGPRGANFNYDSQSSGDRWLEDKSTTGFDLQKNVIGKGGVGGGIYVGAEFSNYASNWYSTEQVVMFFRAIFTSVNGNDVYGTDTIKFETVTE